MFQSSEDVVICETCNTPFVIGDQHLDIDEIYWFCSERCYEGWDDFQNDIYNLYEEG